ncbi:16S rRNA (adenine(1518)-N(6)/adenine(1519)-N(6))-dimethyltransferase, partial [bacterium]|nr:16S rRNA (adenine(1518)-N(6)/adenine(1519)-N(6))-dimethyltransferase [bacterium]
MTRSQQELLRQYGIRPVKRRGQNFLLDGNLARAIATDTLALGDEILELGAGGGALTVHLLEGARTLACVEVDHRLHALLQGEFGNRPGFRAISGDLARLDWDSALAAAGTR